MKHILVIDDDEAVRKLFLLSLEETGYNVYTVSSGTEGIESFKKGQYDLIFLDLKMPGMNGVETLRELRKIDRDVPVYIITAFHEEFFDQLKSAEKDGIDFEVLHKPFDREQLVAVTTGILDQPTSY
jgi:CheY-like chemotaxis protein